MLNSSSVTREQASAQWPNVLCWRAIAKLKALTRTSKWIWSGHISSLQINKVFLDTTIASVLNALSVIKKLLVNHLTWLKPVNALQHLRHQILLSQRNSLSSNHNLLMMNRISVVMATNRSSITQTLSTAQLTNVKYYKKVAKSHSVNYHRSTFQSRTLKASTNFKLLKTT